MLHLCSWGFKDLFGNWKLGACFMAHSHCLLCFFCSLQMGSELCWQKSDQNWDTYPNLWEQMCHDQAMSYSNTSPSLMQHSLTKGQLGASQGSDRENHERKEASLCPAKVRHGKAIASWRTLLDGIPHYVIPYVFGRTRSWVNQVWEGRLIIMLKYIGNSSLREKRGGGWLGVCQGSFKALLSFIWAFPLVYWCRNRWQQITAIIHHICSAHPTLLHLCHGLKARYSIYLLLMQLPKEWR